jgi:hypothetical protein
LQQGNAVRFPPTSKEPRRGDEARELAPTESQFRARKAIPLRECSRCSSASDRNQHPKSLSQSTIVLDFNVLEEFFGLLNLLGDKFMLLVFASILNFDVHQEAFSFGIFRFASLLTS